MSSPPFVHLHCHSHYSLLDGASKIPDLVERTKALGMPALALTDHGNLYGAVELLREAKAAGILPIVGMEAYVAPGQRTERSGGGVSGQEHAFHLTLLRQDAAGFRNLMRLSSLSFLEGFYYKPRIDKEILERHARGTDLPVRLRLGRVLRLHPARQDGRSRTALRLVSEDLRRGELLRRDPGQRRGDPEGMRRGGDRHRPADGPAAGRHQRRPLPDPRRRRRARRAACASTPARRSTTRRRMRFETQEFFVRSPDEMYAAMPGHEEALAASARIAAMVEPHYESLGLGAAASRRFSRPSRRRPRTTCASSARRACATRYGDDPAARGARAARPRAGRSSTGWASPPTS